MTEDLSVLQWAGLACLFLTAVGGFLVGIGRTMQTRLAGAVCAAVGVCAMMALGSGTYEAAGVLLGAVLLAFAFVLPYVVGYLIQLATTPRRKIE